MISEFTTKYAAWVGVKEDDHFKVDPDDMLFTDDLEEAKAFRSQHGDLPVGSTLGISAQDGIISTVTNTGKEYIVEQEAR